MPLSLNMWKLALEHLWIFLHAGRDWKHGELQCYYVMLPWPDPRATALQNLVRFFFSNSVCACKQDHLLPCHKAVDTHRKLTARSADGLGEHVISSYCRSWQGIPSSCAQNRAVHNQLIANTALNLPFFTA